MAGSLTLKDWLKQIRSEVYNILASHKNVVVHRAKLACLCTELFRFHKMDIPIHERLATPGENQKFNELSNALYNMRKVSEGLTNDTWFNTVIKTSSSKFIADLQAFRKTFNKCTQDLGILQGDHCPINSDQIQVDDVSDSQGLIEYIDALLGAENTLTDEEKAILKERKEECEKTIQKNKIENEACRQEKNENLRVLSEKEVADSLAQFKKWDIKIEDFELQKKLGAGAFADVYLGYQTKTGKIVGLKELKKQRLTASDLKSYKREISIFSALNGHFAILPFVGASLHHKYCIATEFMANGSLYDRLHKPAIPFDATHKTICALGIAQGMAYMHQKNIIHRDLKSLNVLLDSDDFPKICDFGVSRDLSEDPTKPLTSPVGSYRWMSPEVLDSKGYTKKTDVYSYAIVLWELLTQDIPFQGISDSLVADKVLNNDARPIFPQNAPTNIVKVIKMCWDKNPEKRPDFETIAKMFTTGCVKFPGTNMDQVTAYINQFATTQQDIGEFDAKNVSNKTLDQIISDLSSENETVKSTALAKLRHIVSIPEWREKLCESSVISVVVKLMNTCVSVKAAFDLVYIVFYLFFYEKDKKKKSSRKDKGILGSYEKDTDMIKAFAKQNGLVALLDILLKFGSASMPNIIYALSALIKSDFISNDNATRLTVDHFAKLASFLSTTDVNIRIASTELICLIIEKKLYATSSALTAISNCVMLNAVSESKVDLLRQTLNLIKLLLKFQNISTRLARSEGPECMKNLLDNGDPDIVSDALDILRAFCTDNIPSKETVINLVSKFKDVISRNNDKLTLKALYLVGVLVGIKGTPDSFREFVNVTKSFAECLSSKVPAIIAYTLQLIFAFLSNPVSTVEFSKITESIVPHLSSSNIGIAAIAASCLTIILMNNSSEYCKYVCCDDAVSFIKKSLEKEELQQCGIRLAGVISMSYSGARFLDKSKVMALIGNLLKSENQAIRKLAFMAFSSFASSLPISKSAISAVPIFISNLNDKEVGSYSLLCISSITEVPGGPKACISYLSQLSRLLSINDDETTIKTFDTLINIFSDSSIVANLEEEKTGVKDIVDATKRFWDSPTFMEPAFELLEAVSKLHLGRGVLRMNHVPRFAVDHIDDPKYSYVRRFLLRILTRTELKRNSSSNLE